jgi:hypothetical protein
MATDDDNEGDKQPNWRDPSAYDYTRNLTREDWAWEFLRRNPSYTAIAAQLHVAVSQFLRRSPMICVIASAGMTETVQAVGCVLCELPIHPAGFVSVFWRSDLNPAVLPVEAHPTDSRDGDAFDVRNLCHPVVVLRSGDGIEHVLLCDNIHRLQLEVRQGSLLEGPVRLRYDLAGFDKVKPKLLALRQLLALQRFGRFTRSLNLAEIHKQRWLTALRALDGVRAGASHREIASGLWGGEIVREDWRSESDYLRSRVRRTIRNGETLANGGYLRLLKR